MIPGTGMFSVFFVKKLKSFEKGVDICVVMVYNVVTEQEKSSKIKKDEVLEMKYQKVCYYRIGEEYNWQRIDDEGWTKEISEEKAKEVIDVFENELGERKFVDNKNGYVYFNIHNPDKLHYHQMRIYCL